MFIIHLAGRFWDAIAEEWTLELDGATRMSAPTAARVSRQLGADFIPDPDPESADRRP